jgi:methyl-accepting chemotaxis protein
MKWFSNLKISSKLLLSFAAVLIPAVILGVFAIMQLASVNERTTDIAGKWLPSVQTIGAVKSNAVELRVHVMRHLLSEDPAKMETIDKQIVEAGAALDKEWTGYTALIYSPEERKVADEFRALWKQYVTMVNEKALPLSRAAKTSEALTVIDTECRPLYLKAAEAIDRLIDINKKGSETAAQAAAASYATARLWIIGVLGGCVAFSVLVAIVVAKVIGNPLRTMAGVAAEMAKGNIEQSITIDTRDETGLLARSFRQIIEALRGVTAESNTVIEAAKAGRLSVRGDASRFDGAFRQLVLGLNETLDAAVAPITEASAVLDKVADRNLTVRVTGDYKGDHAQIKNALNTTLDNLQEALSQVSVGAEQVTAAATQIANGSQSLAQGASEQAGSLEEISSSLEEMASMTKQNADNSNQGKVLANEATASAQRGNEAMHRMGDAISKIKASSDATAKIVKTIDEIAFQTNLLALNAAVEAARAGEAGKGFAVVAEEVRNLAQRSAEAAKNTANMIEESVKNADGGVRITEEVAKILVEIGEGNRKVNDLIAEIAAASNEQSKGIEQVNLAVTQLDKVTQSNAANSEEAASAAEELNGQASSLAQVVGQFKLSNDNVPPKAAKPVAHVAAPPAKSESKPRAESGPAKHRQPALVGAGAGRNGHAKAEKLIPLDDEDFKGF